MNHAYPSPYFQQQNMYAGGWSGQVPMPQVYLDPVSGAPFMVDAYGVMHPVIYVDAPNFAAEGKDAAVAAVESVEARDVDRTETV
jgi:hypothetical protein